MFGCAAHVAVGLGTAVAFLAGGAVRILPEPVSISLGARLILLPGVVVLWPVVARRLLNSYLDDQLYCVPLAIAGFVILICRLSDLGVKDYLY